MNKYLAEGFGTAVLVLVGCGSAIIAGEALGLLGVALAFGLAVMTMIYTIGNISWCHINPAITLAMWIAGKINSYDAIWYVVSQCIGAVIACLILLGIAVEPGVFAANQVGTGYSTFTVLLGEAVFTGLFITVIFAATAKKWAGDLAGIVIGLTLAMCIMVMGPVSNASFNPARSFGPALLSGGTPLSELWMFIVWPVMWAVFAVILWKTVLGGKE